MHLYKKVKACSTHTVAHILGHHQAPGTKPNAMSLSVSLMMICHKNFHLKVLFCVYFQDQCVCVCVGVCTYPKCITSKKHKNINLIFLMINIY